MLKLKILFIAIIFNFSTFNANAFNWQQAEGGITWALNCDFKGNDIMSVVINGEQCGPKCVQTNGCTHFVWTNYKGGTCWMKQGSASINNAVYNGEVGTVCGVVSKNTPDKPDNLIPTTTWSDEFNYGGKPDPNLWSQEIGGHGWGNNELQFYTDSNANVQNGNLIIETRKENKENRKYTSTRLISKKAFRYGIFEMRAKIPKGRGTWPAFWLLSSKRPLNWPLDGEIDIMEHVGYDPGVMHGAIHCQKYNGMIGTQKGGNIKINNPFDEFHTYKVDWNANRIIFYVDNQEYFRYNNENNSPDTWPYNGEMNIILNTAIGGDWGGIQGVDDSIFPVRYTIDYVRYSK